MIYILAAVAVVIGVAALVVWCWPDAPRTTSAPEAPAAPDAVPMTGLESALAQVKDRSGRPIGERLEDEHVDDLRVPDDTGPLLRRALDHVSPKDRPDEPATGPDDSADQQSS